MALKRGQIYSVEQLVNTSLEEVVSMTGLDKKKVEKILVAAERKLFPNDPNTFESGLEHETILDTKRRLELGLPLIDNHLVPLSKGDYPFKGLEAGTLVELYGPQWGGKTLLCAQIAVLSEILIQGEESPSKVVWFDADGTFREDTIKEIAFRFRLDPERAIERIRVVEMVENLTMNDYFDVVLKLSATERITLIIIDSLKQAKAKYDDSPTLPRLLNKIKHLRIVTDAICIVTNRSLMNLRELSTQVESSFGGHPLRHEENYQFLLEPKKEDELHIGLIHAEGIAPYKWTVMHGYGGLFQDRKSMKLQERRVSRYIRRLKKTKGMQIKNN